MLPILQSGLMSTLLSARLPCVDTAWDPQQSPTHTKCVLLYNCAEAPLNLKQGKPGEKYSRKRAYTMTSREGVPPKLGAGVAPRSLTNI